MELLRSVGLFFLGILKRIYWLLPIIFLDPIDVVRRLWGVNLNLPQWLNWVLFILCWFVAIILTYHELRKQKVVLEKRAKLKLQFVREVNQILGTSGESFGLEIFNQGSNLADGCQGILVAVEFAVEQEGLSMRRWPVNCPLVLPNSIGGQLSSTLEVIHSKPSSHSSFKYYFAYLDNADGRELSLPTGQDILIVIGVSSKDAMPLYAICLFHAYDKPYPTNFEIIDLNLENRPIIEQCRQLLVAHKAKVEQK